MHAQPSDLAPESWVILIGSGNSLYISTSASCWRAFFAIVWNACSTLVESFAEVSKYGMPFLPWHQDMARFCEMARPSKSILLPKTTNGKFSGSRGEAWMRNSSRQLSNVSNVFATVTSNTRTQKAAPSDWNRSCPAVSQICIVTNRSSTMTSFVRKSAPMVALYWLENLLFTYRFINEVLPTPESPKMMTFSRTFLREAMMQ